MPVAVDNPYQSPPVNAEQLEPVQLPRQPSRSTIATAVFGVWAGILYGGIFGLVGSSTLGLSRGLVLGWNQLFGSLGSFSAPEKAIIVATAGAVSGFACGLLIGPITGIVASWPSKTTRRAAVYWSIVLCTFAGCSIGSMGSTILFAQSFHLENGYEMPITLGTLIGSITGLTGGLQLSKTILAFVEQPTAYNNNSRIDSSTDITFHR